MRLGRGSVERNKGGITETFTVGSVRRLASCVNIGELMQTCSENGWSTDGNVTLTSWTDGPRTQHVGTQGTRSLSVSQPTDFTLCGQMAFTTDHTHHIHPSQVWSQLMKVPEDGKFNFTLNVYKVYFFKLCEIVKIITILKTADVFIIRYEHIQHKNNADIDMYYWKNWNFCAQANFALF